MKFLIDIPRRVELCQTLLNFFPFYSGFFVLLGWWRLISWNTYEKRVLFQSWALLPKVPWKPANFIKSIQSCFSIQSEGQKISIFSAFIFNFSHFANKFTPGLYSKARLNIIYSYTKRSAKNTIDSNLRICEYVIYI